MSQLTFHLSFDGKSVREGKVVTVVEGGPKGSLLQKLLHHGVGESTTSFPGLLHFTLDPYLIMLSVKQGSIKYHF